jgi:predicted  nucleic acid-binding Zn-ribbon protein
MPHMCTRCNSVFEDGMDVLEGCPVCGWNKFLFVKSKDKIKEVRGALKASEIGGPYEPWPEGDDSLRQILKASPRQDRKTDRPKEVRKDRASRKERRNENAKGKHGFFDIDSPKDRSQNSPARGSDKLRHDEDKTVESIRMPEPGTYELNLSSLFERDELVMAVKEGTYLIDLSSAFKKSKKD